MGTLFGFAVGYVLGARVGARGFEEVSAAFAAVRSSQEFRAFRSLGVAHVRSVLAEVVARLGPQPALDGASRRDQALRRAGLDPEQG